MRLCIISHAYLEQGYSSTLESMAAYPGVELTWITPGIYDGRSYQPSAQANGAGPHYTVLALPIFLASRQGTFLYLPWTLSKALDTCKPDVILHEQEVFALNAAQIARAARRRGIPLLMFASENIARQLAFPRRLLMKWVFQRCTAMITVSEQAAARHRLFGFTGPIAVIAQMGPEINPKPVFGRRGGGMFLVCFAGRLVESKGVDCLLQAVAHLKDEGLDVACTIAGKGPLANQLQQLASELGIRQHVTFAGSLSLLGVAALLRQSDVLVLPSRRTRTWEEQFGRILTEAMAEATVTVGSNTGAIPEVIGSTELIFDENDDFMLATCLHRLATDAHYLQTQQHILWERARDRFQGRVLTRRRIEFLRSFVHVEANPVDARFNNSLLCPPPSQRT